MSATMTFFGLSISIPGLKAETESMYTILYYTILYYTILYYTILYYTILYYTILYYTILYYTILYYTILYYTILYYTILYYTRTVGNPKRQETWERSLLSARLGTLQIPDGTGISGHQGSGGFG